MSCIWRGQDVCGTVFQTREKEIGIPMFASRPPPAPHGSWLPSFINDVLRLSKAAKGGGGDTASTVPNPYRGGAGKESGGGFELLFFPRLRHELRTQLRQSPRVVRFRGLRGCVKQLAGARRWSHRCEKLQDQIVEYLRGCLTAEPEQNECALVVE